MMKFMARDEGTYAQVGGMPSCTQILSTVLLAAAEGGAPALHDDDGAAAAEEETDVSREGATSAA
jgi:hypothetical protein